MTPSPLRRVAAIAIAVGVGVSMTACGDDDSSSDGTGSTGSAAPARSSAPAETSPPADDAASGTTSPDVWATTTGETAEPGASTEPDASEPTSPTLAPGEDPAETGFAPISVDGDPLPELEDEDNDPAVGMPAPALAGMSYDQQPTSFTPGEAPTLLVFLAHWCPHCNDEIPMMLEWAADGQQPDGLEIIGVSTATDANNPNFPPGPWLVDKEWEWPVIADDATYSAALSYGLSGFPFMVLVDADGNVVARAAGEKPPDDLTDFVAQVETT